MHGIIGWLLSRDDELADGDSGICIHLQGGGSQSEVRNMQMQAISHSLLLGCILFPENWQPKCTNATTCLLCSGAPIAIAEMCSINAFSHL